MSLVDAANSIKDKKLVTGRDFLQFREELIGQLVKLSRDESDARGLFRDDNQRGAFLLYLKHNFWSLIALDFDLTRQVVYVYTGYSVLGPTKTIDFGEKAPEEFKFPAQRDDLEREVALWIAQQAPLEISNKLFGPPKPAGVNLQQAVQNPEP